MRDDRKKIWVNQFQTRLLIRVAIYLAAFVFCWTNLLFTWRLLTDGRGNPLQQYGAALLDSAPAVLCLVLMMPVLIYDSLRFTHRLVGPLVRFRHAMQAIARGEAVRPIKLRAGDYLGELRDDFNAMLEAQQKLGLSVLKPLDDTTLDAERKIG